MSKVIYVSGADDRLTEVLVSALRAEGYTFEYADAAESVSQTGVAADILINCRPLSSMGQITLGDVTVDMDMLSITTAAGEYLHLTPTEFALFSYLLKNHSRAVPREELLKVVWHIEDASTRVADDTVKRLRKKLKNTQLVITTIWGYGFKLNERMRKD